MLKLLVQSANNLINVDFGPNNLSDPYVAATFRGVKQKTAHIDNNLNPVWTSEHNNELQWDVGDEPIQSSDEIFIKVRDYEKILRKKLLGQLTIPLRDLLKTKDYTIEQTYKLRDSHDRPIVGTLSLRLQYTPSSKVLEYMVDEVDAGELDQDNEEHLEEEIEEVRDKEGKLIRRRKKRGHLHGHGREWSTKKKYFKITIAVLEGRQLPGTNISPITRVTVKNIKHATRVKKSTNKPVFNQTFTFNFHCSEAELFDELIIFEVFDSKPLIGRSTLGFFEIEIGTIYEMKDHSAFRKWVWLTGIGIQDDDVDDNHFVSKLLRKRGKYGGPAGYLKVSMTVLGSGDQLTSLRQLEGDGVDEDDIDANCLKPSGATQEPAEFHVKVYLAQDLPQMDAGFTSTIRNFLLPGKTKTNPDEKKKLVDPYFVFNFSGKKVKTQIVYGENNPSFNKLLKLPIMYPTMCERIKLELYDKDTMNNPNDIIATSFLSLSEISGNEYSSSFLPHFGPCFVNFYGSPREFSIFTRDDFEKLNKGIGEGVSYRGRVLLEMTQERSSGNVIHPSTHKVHPEDIIRVQAYLRQKQFKLFACFKNASMISKIDKPVEFEVSIGNFGNALDETEISCNTPPSNPIYDGCHYHYLPWHRYKPCICLDCNWEDILFRIESLNIINRLYEMMELQVSEAKTYISEAKISISEAHSQEPYHEKVCEAVRPCLQQFIIECSNAMPYLKLSKPKTPPVNKLDLSLEKLRQEELQFIVDQAQTWVTKIESVQEFDEKDEENVIEDMEDYVSRLKSLAFEPQLSIPDVIIWMICGGDRIAYHRVPIQDVMFSTNEIARGKYCGTTIELLLKHPVESHRDKEFREVPAMIRVELWVGLRKHQMAWINRKGQEGSFKIYAESYENEMRTPIGTWANPPSLFRPHFSNATGDIPLEMKNFRLESGWTFHGEANAVLDRSAMYYRDSGHNQYTDEVYEHQSRDLLGGDWNSNSRWTEEDGQPCRSIDDFQVHLGWKWTSEWKVDTDRAVDAEGWEYSLYENHGIYSNASKAIHMSRRRRFVRTRELEDTKGKQRYVKDKKQKSDDDWEYAKTFQSKFHVSRRSTDVVRRKRFLKEIVHEKGTEIKELPPKLSINLNYKKDKTAKKSKSKDKQESTEETSKDIEGFLPVMPRMFIVYEKPYKFQLWVYIYQAKDLLSMDDSGQSDPYVRVAFCNQSQKTEWISQTLCPKWDQTLVFPSIELFDRVENVVRDPPNIIMEVFDRDSVGRHDFIGRCMFQPMVQTNGSKKGTKPTLTWITLHNRQHIAGQILTAAELFLDEGAQLPNLPSPRKTSRYSPYIYPVRDEIRPKLQMIAVEILCWGVRNMKKVDRPSVEFEWGGRKISSEVIQNMKKNPNFSRPALEREILHLEEGVLRPPMNIKVYDTRHFNRKQLVGMTTITPLELQYLQPHQETADFEAKHALRMPTAPKYFERRNIPEHLKDKEKFDWWSKYYYSIMTNTTQRQRKQYPELDNKNGRKSDHLQIYGERKFGTIKIYDRELEKIESFEGLNDFVTSFNLHGGRKWTGNENDDLVGELKANIRVFPVENENKGKLPEATFNNLPEIKMNWPLKCLVRVYIIRAFDLPPCDPTTGLADPYVVVSLGGITRGKEEDSLKNTLNPIFGKMFEFNVSIPIAKDLKIKVVDSDCGFDDDIGETTIDLEQRLLTRLHATCGLPTLYYKDGPYEWRDSKKPLDILKEYCEANGYKKPSFYPKEPTSINLKEWRPNSLVLESKTHKTGRAPQEYNVKDLENYDSNRSHLGEVEQQLSLHALHRLGLIPEHVETRPLYSSLQPGIEQGRLQLWVDIFPKTSDADIKPAVNVAPRTSQPYVLRVIVWDTTNVELQDVATLTKERMSDIYVKCWIDGIDEKQKTDVHQRSLDGDGNFNWRMCFPLNIMPIEKQLVVSEKGKFYHLHETTKQIDPILKIQIWDADTLPGTDDFIGQRTLNLNHLVKPCKSPSQCDSKYDPGHREKQPDDFVDLFHDDSKSNTSVRGWYACWKNEETKKSLGGKVDVSIELLTEEQANKFPAGLGRSDPNQYPHLPEPNRPKTSFLWFLSPFKTMRYIIWRNFKGKIIGFIIFVLLVLLIILFVYNVPGYSVKKLFKT